LKSHKSSGTDKIQAELIPPGCFHTHNLIHSIWKKEELPQHKKSIITPTYVRATTVT
jgi:hypothetical protein